MSAYAAFLNTKTHLHGEFGFESTLDHAFLFPFQREILSFALRKGRSAVFADCGLGKTPMQLCWSENVYKHTGKPVLILTPLAVGFQTVREGSKFGMECAQSRDGTIKSPIVVTNYQQLHKFNADSFSGVACDESSILKNFDGAIKSQITEFMRRVKYRSLWTATAAPNDYIELGTSSEALGCLGFVDMLGMFFKKSKAATSRRSEYSSGMWRFRGHAERDFWRWVCSWARAVRKPSDLGFEDGGFKLPDLQTVEHVVKAVIPRDDCLFDMPAITLQEQRAERRRTLQERCEMAATLINQTGRPAVAWCHLNDEGNLLEKLIPGSVEVDGNDDDEFKEEAFESFANGGIKVIISKPTIAGFGLNWQHCAHQTFFPSHSFEQWYQAIRRCWRFGQTQTVKVDVITSEGERAVLLNLQRKAQASEVMFARLVELMGNELKLETATNRTLQPTLPTWLSSTN